MCSLWAQGVRLEGRVVDDNGEPLEMAHVRLAKSSIGTLTNFKGEYSLMLPEGDSLAIIFTSIGFRRVEKRVNTRAAASANENPRIVLNVQMRTNEAYINDV
ncbi:MAG: carboxypeptidase-like regulatory domain-containing protein, partial [Bacteroidales bacterium]|nr:carboxypeptidase-like regulatory domain-containing protein [Bacteroidales bacterium]